MPLTDEQQASKEIDEIYGGYLSKDGDEIEVTHIPTCGFVTKIIFCLTVDPNVLLGILTSK
jgi:hypothetical protein